MDTQINFLIRIFRRFLTEKDAKGKIISDTSEKESYYITISYLESESWQFTYNLAKIIKNKIEVNIILIDKSFKIDKYFQLKSNTLLSLCSNVRGTLHTMVCLLDIDRKNWRTFGFQ